MQASNIFKILWGFLLCYPSFLWAQSSNNLSFQFSVSFPSDKSKEALDGRLMLFLSNNDAQEPRFQVSDGPETQLLFGKDVEGLAPNRAVSFQSEDFGYPLPSLSEVPKGTYYVQALLHRYETFKRSDGHTVKLPMNRGAGQNWRKAPGNLYSEVIQVNFDPKKNQKIELSLNQENPPLPEPEDSKYVKHIKIRSKLLSDFWGRDIFLGAFVLLPEGFDTHPEAKYPLCVFHGHFPSEFGGFRESPPDPDLEPDYSARFGVKGYNKIVQQEAHDFYKWWTGPEAPGCLSLRFNTPTPFMMILML